MKGGDKMLRFTVNFFKMFLLCFVVCIFLSSVNTIAQQVKVAGEMTCVTTEYKGLDIGDLEGHSFSISESDGLNKSIGPN